MLNYDVYGKMQQGRGNQTISSLAIDYLNILQDVNTDQTYVSLKLF